MRWLMYRDEKAVRSGGGYKNERANSDSRKENFFFFKLFRQLVCLNPGRVAILTGEYVPLWWQAGRNYDEGKLLSTK